MTRLKKCVVTQVSNVIPVYLTCHLPNVCVCTLFPVIVMTDIFVVLNVVCVVVNVVYAVGKFGIFVMLLVFYLC